MKKLPRRAGRRLDPLSRFLHIFWTYSVHRRQHKSEFFISNVLQCFFFRAGKPFPDLTREEE